MADVKLLKYDGTEQQYPGVERVQLATVGGGTAIFSYGEAVEGIEISPDFSGGDMTVDAPAGTLVKSAVIKRPDTLIPENIPQGINIGGVEGSKVIPISVEKEIFLDFSDGDMEVTPESGKSFSKVTIPVPENLVPENIPAGINIGGVDGSKVIPDPVETEVTLDFSAGAMEVTPDTGTVFSKVSIPVPENLIPENIPDGMNIAGIIGKLVAGKNVVISSGKTWGMETKASVVTHGLGVTPDIVLIQSEISGTGMSPTSGKYYITNGCGISAALYGGLDEKYSFMMQYGAVVYNKAFTQYRAGWYITSTDTSKMINNANAETFSFGSGTYVCMNCYYYWIAIGGLT